MDDRSEEKEKYFKKLQNFFESHCKTDRNVKKPWSSDRISKVIQQIKNSRVTMQRKTMDYYWVSKFRDSARLQSRKNMDLCKSEIFCDDTRRPEIERDGILSEGDRMPWLGLLRIHLAQHGHGNGGIAVTGIVLVKFNYAIANAHDIARIPDGLLRNDVDALFTPATSKKYVYFKVGRAFIHKDYKKGIHNTLAIIEILKNKFSFNLLKPICLIDTKNSFVYYAQDDFHVFGYTDERRRLEQKVRQLREVENKVCLRYYKRNSLASSKLWPSKFYCCEEKYNNLSEVCVYENGMVLASLSVKGNEGIWSLLGLSARGPGCLAPSRFINITPYMKWILSVLGKDERILKGDKEILDVKDLTQISRRSNFEDGWKAGWEHHYGGNDRDYYRIFDFDRVSDTALYIYVFQDTYELRKGACEKDIKKQIYIENTTIEFDPKKVGMGAYRISIMDLYVKEYTCIKVEIDCEDKSVAQVYYTIGEDEQDEIFKPMDYHDKRYILDRRNYANESFINLYVRFSFRGQAKLKIAFYGPQSTHKKTIGNKWPGIQNASHYILNLLVKQYFANLLG